LNRCGTQRKPNTPRSASPIVRAAEAQSSAQRKQGTEIMATQPEPEPDVIDPNGPDDLPPVIEPDNEPVAPPAEIPPDSPGEYPTPQPDHDSPVRAGGGPGDPDAN